MRIRTVVIPTKQLGNSLIVTDSDGMVLTMCCLSNVEKNLKPYRPYRP